MTADELKKLTTNALNELATALDQGQSERLTAMLKTMARFHRYSMHNVCLIASQRPTATRVAGFQTWRALGRYVRRGEKGIAILAPIISRRSSEPSDDSKTVVGFRTAYVFDVEQTDGAPLPEPAQACAIPVPRPRRSKQRFSRTASSSTAPTILMAPSGLQAADVFRS